METRTSKRKQWRLVLCRENELKEEAGRTVICAYWGRGGVWRGVIVFVGIVCGCCCGDMQSVLGVKGSVVLILSYSDLILIIWIYYYKGITNTILSPVQTRNDLIHFHSPHPRRSAILHSNLTQIHTNPLTTPIPPLFSFQRI